MKNLFAVAALAVSCLCAAQSAHAASTTLDLTGPKPCSNLTTCTLTLSGGDLNGTQVTFANPLDNDGGPDLLWQDGNGLVVGSGGLPLSMSVVFNTDALWTETTGQSSGLLGFSVFGGSISPTTVGAVSGSFYAESGLNLLFEAGTSYIFQSNQHCVLTTCGLNWIQSMTFEAASTPAVPLPASGLLLLSGLGLIGMRRRAKA